MRFLCARCYHMYVTGSEPRHRLSSAAFMTIAWICLAVLILAGSALCILYLSGTGDFAWFILLSALMLFSVVCPAAVLLKKRNLTMLTAALYLPLGVWAYLWYLAPGVNWEYSGITAYGGIFFFLIGLAALFLFTRDLRSLPRL
jgi:hypothetical protein